MSDPPPSITAIAEDLRRASQLLWDPSPANMDSCRATFARALERARASHAEIKAAASRDRALLGIARVLETEIAVCEYLLQKTIALHRELIETS